MFQGIFVDSFFHSFRQLFLTHTILACIHIDSFRLVPRFFSTLTHDPKSVILSISSSFVRYSGQNAGGGTTHTLFK